MSDVRSLYRLYRPPTFSALVAQDAIAATLRNAVQRQELAHAYLLIGPRGTGKTSVARILYRAVCCAQPADGDPCGACPACLRPLAASMDLLEIDAASNRGIDTVRELRDRVAYRPGDGPYRVIIIDECHKLTEDAWDALLKVLEEPPAHAIFVLATTDGEAVPPTVVSRCQRFDFSLIPFADLRQRVAAVAAAEGIAVTDGALTLLARQARGGLRDALSLLQRLATAGGGQVDEGLVARTLRLVATSEIRRFVEALATRDPAAALASLAALDEGGSARQFLEEGLAYVRHALRARLSGGRPVPSELFDSDTLAWLDGLAARWSFEAMVRALDRLGPVLSYRGDMVLALEAATLDLVVAPAEAETESPVAADADAPAPRAAAPAPPSSPPAPATEPIHPLLRRARAGWGSAVQALLPDVSTLQFLLAAARPVGIDPDGALVVLPPSDGACRFLAGATAAPVLQQVAETAAGRAPLRVRLARRRDLTLGGAALAEGWWAGATPGQEPPRGA